MEVLSRIITSKKVLLGIIASLFTVFGTAYADLEPIVVQGVDALFGILIVVQGALDYKYGSPSDSTNGS